MQFAIGSPRPTSPACAPRRPPRTRHAELLILCARIGYNP
jgi:hypothetical protein